MALAVFDTDRGKIAVQICYDIEFPEVTRIALEKGAQIIFVPFWTDERYAYLRVRYCAHARCIENHVYVAIAGSVGNLPSEVFFPWEIFATSFKSLFIPAEYSSVTLPPCYFVRVPLKGTGWPRVSIGRIGSVGNSIAPMSHRLGFPQ